MRTTWKVAGLLFCSGACALIYQTVWMRQFRLIFGASTYATAAVLAIFMGGLGIGSAILGRRADTHPQPLRFYAHLELMIAAASALSPLLLWIVAKIYFGIGGSVTLGNFLATIVRLLLAALVLGAPTLLMGGTLPAAARAVEWNDDAGRRRVALLYGVNTLGAVTGTLLSTFFMLEVFGNLRTLYVAVLLNALVGIVARSLAVVPTLSEREGEGPGREVREDVALQPPLVLAAAALTGFVFLLMELVWYRMLAPLLGGSTFTFGLILAIALLGIGLEGAAYSFWGGGGRATVGGFALTCSLEAAAMALPFALGDRLAILANLLRSLGTLGFQGHVISWTLLTMIVVFPAAFIAGVQFPLLISLLGRGQEHVGRQVGLTYAWNTAGAIVGSLTGGFGILPLLTAPGTWRAVVILLALLAIAAMVFGVRGRQIGVAIASTLIAAAAIGGTFALGPTAAWRHSGIGAQRAQIPDSLNATRDFLYSNRRTKVWDEDGRESSVALFDTSDLAFIINGKADGSARGDAGTQVMAGLVGGILHPNPRRALVIGLGTGSTAGWLGAIPAMERVDVVELEPAVLRVAAACHDVNHEVLRNPKVHVRIGDAREVLLVSRDRYDIIFSEPSNPYRAGIASLFTEEFYRASAARLNRGGFFLQWLQTYDVDSQTIRTIYATIASAFAHVETWQTDQGDLLLVATRDPIVLDANVLRGRVAQEPFRSALTHAWRVESLEGFLSHFIARDTLAGTIGGQERERNTDDRTLIEFGFARGLTGKERFSMNELAALAKARGEDAPARLRGAIDWAAVAANRSSIEYVNFTPRNPSPDDLSRHRAAGHYGDGALTSVYNEWKAHKWQPVNSAELVMIGEALADAGSEDAAGYADRLRVWQPVDADAIMARLRVRQGRMPEAIILLERVFIACRRDPWPTVDVIGRSLDLALNAAKEHRYAAQLFNSMSQPFAAGLWNDTRRFYLVLLAKEIQGCGPATTDKLRALEPWPPWRKDLLQLRRDCYQSAMMSDLATRAKREWEDFVAAEPAPLLAK